MSLTPAERSMRAKLAAHKRWAKEADPRAATHAARKAMASKFEREVDPDGTMDPAERFRRAEHLRKAHFTALSLASAQARRKKAGR